MSKVRLIPAVVGEQATVESVGDTSERKDRPFKACRQVLCISYGQLVDSTADDQDDSANFGHRDNICYLKCQIDTVAVQCSDETCNMRTID